MQIYYWKELQETLEGTWASVMGKKRHPIKDVSKPALTEGNWRVIHWVN